MKDAKQFEYLKWALFIAAVLIIYKILSKFGIVGPKSEEEKQEEQAETLNLNIDFKEWTNANFYNKKAPKNYQVVLMPMQGADYVVNQIYDSVGYLNDDEEKMFAALKILRYKTQFSFVADRFRILKQKDLVGFLKDAFSTEELYPVWRYLESLPTYKKI
jgi:hypothetical protein